MEHPQMNPTPTPDSPSQQPVDIARMRELLANTSHDMWDVLLDYLQLECNREFIAALRNAAPALLDELETARKERDAAIHERNSCHELWDQILALCGYEKGKGYPGIVGAVEKVIAQRDAWKMESDAQFKQGAKLVAERDKLREEVDGINEALRIANIQINMLMADRDSLRRENAELKAKLEKGAQ